MQNYHSQMQQKKTQVTPGLNVILVPTSDTKEEILKELVDATGIKVALFYFP